MMMLKRRMSVCAAALSIGWIGLACAQETAVEEVSLRVLPLGNRAPFTQVIRDGARHEVDPPEGSLPPREVAVGAVVPDDAKTKPEEKPVRLRLGEVSGAVRMPRPDPAAIALKDQEKGGLWLKQGLAASKSTLLVVWRSGKTWDENRSLALDDSPEAVPAGAARVVNVAPVEVKMIWGKQRYRLLPGKSVILRYPDGSKGVPLEILHTDKNGELRPCLSTTAEADPAKRRQWFVYRADRADARTPIQVLPLSEDR
jgi:hypothetical protein